MSHIDLRAILAYNMTMADMREPEPLGIFVLDVGASSTMANYTNSPPALSTAGRAFLCCRPREKSGIKGDPKNRETLDKSRVPQFSARGRPSQVTSHPLGGVVVSPPKAIYKNARKLLNKNNPLICNQGEKARLPAPGRGPQPLPGKIIPGIITTTHI